MMKYLFLIPVLWLAGSVALIAQSVTGDAELQTEITSLTGTEEADNAAEKLAQLSDNRVNINSGDEDEISRLFFLTSFQVKVLADYIKRHGNIVSVYEIALLPGFDRPTAMLMEPYIVLSSRAVASSGTGSRNTLLFSTLISAPSSGTDSTGVRYVLRLNHSSKRYSYGLTAENDPWEHFTLHKAAGADFVSAHLMYNGKGLLSRLIVGDYSLRFGEGLVISNSSWQGSWLTSPSFASGREVTDAYTSTDENNFFRGVAAVASSATYSAALFISSNSIDARIRFAADSSRYVSNLVTGGLHNTPSGLAARNTLTENTAGIHLTAGGEKIRGGVTLAATRFSLPFIPDTSAAEDLYKFRGRHLLNMGADFRAGTGKLFCFGEAGFSFPGSWAAVTGIRALPDGRITFNLSARYLSPRYHVFHSNIYSSGSTVSNEMGIAGNIHIEAAKHLFVSAGADIYRFPWLRYRSSSPSTGARSELKIEYTPSDRLTLRGSWSLIQHQYDVNDDTGIAGIEIKKRMQTSLLGAWAPSESVTLTSRIVLCHLPETHENGYLLCQDISYSLKKVKVWLRYSLFNTPGWDTRLYAYENDLLQNFSIPALYGDGMRTYLMLQWDVSSHFLIRAKYASTLSGNGESHKTDNDIRLQMKILF